MIAQHGAALAYLFQEDLYLTPADRQNMANAAVEPQPNTTATPIPAVPQPTLPSFVFDGQNLKHFLVLCHYPNTALMEDAHLQALHNTLARINTSPADIALLNLAQHKAATLPNILEFFKPQTLLILGKECLLPGLQHLPLNQITPLGSIGKTLYTFNFSAMMPNQQHKKAFWEQVKQL